MDMASKHPIIRLRVCIHLMVGHSTVLSLAQAVVVSHGAEVVAEYLAAGEGFVGGKRVNCMGAIDEARGIDRFLISPGI
jgi:hypothetical protein